MVERRGKSGPTGRNDTHGRSRKERKGLNERKVGTAGQVWKARKERNERNEGKSLALQKEGIEGKVGKA